MNSILCIDETDSEELDMLFERSKQEEWTTAVAAEAQTAAALAQWTLAQ